MAGDWIKMRGNLWDDPRVSRLCDLTDATEASVIGALYWLWATADQHTEDGCMPGLTLRQIDRKTGVPGFASALCEIGWLRDDPQGVVIANFEEHNGTSAKRRCMDAQRKANSRSVSAPDADKDGTDGGQQEDETRRSAELEKRREEKRENIPSTDVLGGDRPAADAPQLTLVEPPKAKPKAIDCPHLAILALWAEVLPSMPQHDPEQWRGTRADHLRARWRETAASKGWETEDDGLRYFRRLFAYVGQSSFLTGKEHAPNKRPFYAELAWIVSPQSWAKLIEGKYHQEAA